MTGFRCKNTARLVAAAASVWLMQEPLPRQARRANALSALAVRVCTSGWLTQAARPLAGGSPNFARGRVVQAACSVASLATHGCRWYESEQAMPGAARLRRTCSRVSIKSMALSVHLRVASRSAQEVRPNPSFEPTRSGMALGPRGSVVHHPPRGPSTTPPRSAQLKR
jgi:hypothetical protein